MGRRMIYAASAVLIGACSSENVTQPGASLRSDVSATANAVVPIMTAAWSVQQLALPAGYTTGEATAISDNGVAFGWVRQTATSAPIPVRWSNGVVSLLNMPPGLAGAEIVDVSANGLRIIANAKAPNGAQIGVAHWFERGLPALWTSPAITVHGMSRDGHYWTGSYMNWKGQRLLRGEGVYGYPFGSEDVATLGTDVNNGEVYAGIAINGSLARLHVHPANLLGPNPPIGSSFKINNAGTIAGTVTILGTEYAATLAAPYTVPSAKWLGRATAISEKGRVVGHSATQAKTWLGGAPTTLPTPNNAAARALNVNLCGSIVGSAVIARTRVPVMWSYRTIAGPVCD